MPVTPVLLAEIESNSGDQIACNDNFGVGKEYQLRVDNVVNSTDSTTGTIYVNPTNAIQIAPGKPLVVDYINQAGLSNPLTLATVNNQNINIYPNGTGSVYLSRPLYASQIVSNAADSAPLLINSPTRINNSLAVNNITPFSNGSISIIAGNSGVVGGDITISPTSAGSVYLTGNTVVSGNVTTNNLRPQTGETISIAGGISTAGNIAVGGDLSISNVFPITGNSIQINGSATVTGNVVTNNIRPESGNVVQITGGITTTGNVIASDLNLAGNNINLNPSASNVVISGGSTLKVDTINQSTSSQPLTITGSNTLNIGGGVVNISGGSNRDVNITATGTGTINLSAGTVACNNALTAASATCTGNISCNNLTAKFAVIAPFIFSSTDSILIDTTINCTGGITFINGNATLNWYSESSITGTWLYATGTPSSTFKLCRIGCIVFINISGYTAIIPTGSITAEPTFSTVIPSNFRPAVNFKFPIAGSSVYYGIFIDASTGTIIINTGTFNTPIELIINCSYSAI